MTSSISVWRWAYVQNGLRYDVWRNGQGQIKGRSYVDTGTSVISEFYTPLVPKEYDFLKQIVKIAKHE